VNFQTPFSGDVAGVLAECRTLLLSNRKRATNSASQLRRV